MQIASCLYLCVYHFAGFRFQPGLIIQIRTCVNDTLVQDLSLFHSFVKDFPVKTYLLIPILFFVGLSVNGQATKRMIKDTARTPIEGTVFKNGKVQLTAGYRVSLSKDRKIATISKQTGNVVKGSYACDCAGTTGTITTTGADIICSGNQGCQLISTTRKIDFAAWDATAEDVEETRWKYLAIPQ